MKTIIDIQVKSLLKRLEERKIFVTLTDGAKDWLVREGYDPAYGARPLKRAIQRHILDPLAMRVLEGEFREGDVVQVDAGPAGLQFAKQQARRGHRGLSVPPSNRPPNPRGERRAVPRRPSGTMWYGLAFLFLLVAAQTYFLVPGGRQIPYSEFKSLIGQGKVAEATVGEQMIRGTLKPDRLERRSLSRSSRPASKILHSSPSSRSPASSTPAS